jgi:hypothetical protein
VERRGEGAGREALCLANILGCGERTDLCGELVQWVGIYGVDGKRVVSVDGSESGRDYVLVLYLIYSKLAPEKIESCRRATE